MALACEHFAMEALAEQPDAQWLRDLGIVRLDYGSRPLRTSGLDICHDYVGLRNLGNSCYLNSVAPCIHGCAPLREDVTGQSPPKGPLSRHSQRLSQQLSGEDGRWDYVSPAALLRQVLHVAQRGQRTGDTSRRATGCFGGLSAHCLQRHPAPRQGSSSARSTVGLGHASEAVCRLLARTPAARRASSGEATRGGWASFRCQLDLAGPSGRCSPSCHHADGDHR